MSFTRRATASAAVALLFAAGLAGCTSDDEEPADAADLIGDGVARSGTDRARLRDLIETSQVDGLSGPIRMTPDNHSGLMPQALTLLVARSGRWRLLT